jgi:hypothetical protein
MATQWYYQEAGEERGPVAFRELVALVRSQAITETDLVRSSWKSEWQPADTVVGLFHMAGRPVAELTPSNPLPTEPIVAEAPADVAAPGTGDATERPGWLTRLFSTTGSRKQAPSQIPTVGTAAADHLAVTSSNDAGPMPIAATSSPEQFGAQLSGDDSRPTSSPGSDAWASAVEEAVARADLRAAGLNPPAGRWRRLARRVANPFTAMRDLGYSRWIRPAFRLVSAIVCANLVALALEAWSAEEDLRFPRRETTVGQDAGGRHFPFVGRCGSGEYAFLVFDVMLVTGAAGYFGARWLDTRAE